MAVDEVRQHVRRRLEELMGAEGASYLMDRPPGGWSDLVTNATLDAKLAALEQRLLAEIERRFRIQTTFLVSAMIVGMGLIGVLVR
jgi:hypothetical protein